MQARLLSALSITALAVLFKRLLIRKPSRLPNRKGESGLAQQLPEAFPRAVATGTARPHAGPAHLSTFLPSNQARPV